MRADEVVKEEEHGIEASTPVADDCVRYLDIHRSAQDQGNVTEGVLALIEHGQSHEDYIERIPHPLEIRLSKQFGHGWGSDHGWFGYKNGVIAFLVVMKKHRFLTHRGSRGWTFTRPAGTADRGIWCKLMPTFLTLVFLMSMNVFSVTIKVRFCCTSGSLPGILLPWGLVSFREYMCFVVKPLYQKGYRVLNFHFTLQSDVL